MSKGRCGPLVAVPWQQVLRGQGRHLLPGGQRRDSGQRGDVEAAELTAPWGPEAGVCRGLCPRTRRCHCGGRGGGVRAHLGSPPDVLWVAVAQRSLGLGTVVSLEPPVWASSGWG